MTEEEELAYHLDGIYRTNVVCAVLSGLFILAGIVAVKFGAWFPFAGCVIGLCRAIATTGARYEVHDRWVTLYLARQKWLSEQDLEPDPVRNTHTNSLQETADG